MPLIESEVRAYEFFLKNDSLPDQKAEIDTRYVDCVFMEQTQLLFVARSNAPELGFGHM